MIPFNVPPFVGKEKQYIDDVIKNRKICGDGPYCKKCKEKLSEMTGADVLLTTSCTHALEMAAMLCGVKEGDEVILPSFTFASTADAFAMRGATLVFVDIRPDTMNIDEKLIEDAITSRTRVIVPVHYAGVGCEMDEINAIAARHGLDVVEDAAQAILATYKGKPLGTFGRFGCLSFHETKNLSMGEGGALIMKTREDLENAEIIREKGTDRSRFFRGQVDKYTWIDAGSSYLPSELCAAYLYAQLEEARKITDERVESCRLYRELLSDLAAKGIIDLQYIPDSCIPNGHMFYIKVKDLDERTRMISYLKENGVNSVFHYVPLHSSPGGRKHGRFHGNDTYTTKESDRLLRMPMYYGLERKDIEYVCDKIHGFFK